MLQNYVIQMFCGLGSLQYGETTLENTRKTARLSWTPAGNGYQWCSV